MAGEQLDLPTVRSVLEDAHQAGVNRARFYGGEPLLHKDLPAMIEHSVALGMDTYITTNGTLLAERIDELYAAGLRWMTIGFYGVNEDYDGYTQRPGHFDRLRRGIEAVRRKYGDRIEIQINFMLYRRSCALSALRSAWQFAREHDLFLGVDPISRTIPFFQDPDHRLAIGEDLRAELDAVTAELLRLKWKFPHRLPPSEAYLRALPDLLLKDAAATIPCDAYQLLWIGADGTVQLCDVHFRLGNVHERPLREILFGEAHCKASRDGFQLKCPTCMCKIDGRIRKHAESQRRYGS
jgi:cyclic pyranopterin phosphate synthase